jgi:glycosyltransferase involved in cell wall biosynthesis
MRVLVLASDCNPDWPSLPVVAFKACRALARVAKVVVATHVRNRPAIERDRIPGAEVVYLDNEYVASPLYKLAKVLRGGSSVAWTIDVAMSYPSYLGFEWEVWKRFKGELTTGGFDVVHRLTPMSPTIPSPLAKWSKVPFVLGPVNGGLKWPRAFTGELFREREWLTYLRGGYRLLPYYQSTYRRSAAVLAGFAHTIADLPGWARDRVIDFPEVGIDPTVFAADRPRRVKQGQMTVLYAGRLVPYKCPDIVVAAFAASPLLRRHRLRVVGGGPEMPRLEQLVKEHRLEGCVELLGQRTQAEVGRAMREADIFAFPSVRELGAGVLVEAMAAGLPCVVVDYGAPGTLIAPDRGIALPLAPKEKLIQDYAGALESLVTDPQRVCRLGNAANRYALAEYSWEAKARKILEVYRWVLGRRGDKPTFESTSVRARCGSGLPGMRVMSA